MKRIIAILLTVVLMLGMVSAACAEARTPPLDSGGGNDTRVTNEVVGYIIALAFQRARDAMAGMTSGGLK